MSDHEPERQAIREAMGRLLDGNPIRSDGKLTIISLADEADVKRWILTHRHQDNEIALPELPDYLPRHTRAVKGARRKGSLRPVPDRVQCAG